jgi:hypothetical protein
MWQNTTKQLGEPKQLRTLTGGGSYGQAWLAQAH